MNRHLITGATTPLGRALIAELLVAPDTEAILAVGIEPPSRVDLPDDPRLTYTRANLARSRSIRKLLFGPAKDLKLTTIAHLAQHRSAAAQGREAYALNVESIRDLMPMAERHPTLRRFVYRSYAEVYAVRADKPQILAEDHPLNLAPRTPQWIRDRVEADLTVCTRMGMSPLSISVLRFAECLAPDMGSQLHDYLQSRVCFRPLGFDPMLNLTTVADMARALALALRSEAQGVFNIPAWDTLPLSRVIQLAGRHTVPVPGPLMTPLYAMRSRTLGTDFRYDLNAWRFHFSGVLDGSRARHVLGFDPTHPIDWATLAALLP